MLPWLGVPLSRRQPPHLICFLLSFELSGSFALFGSWADYVVPTDLQTNGVFVRQKEISL